MPVARLDLVGWLETTENKLRMCRKAHGVDKSTVKTEENTTPLNPIQRFNKRIASISEPTLCVIFAGI